jgi:hypothetical protein
MNYQFFHRVDLYDQCIKNKAKNQVMGLGPVAKWCNEHGILHDALGDKQINAWNILLNEWTGIYWLWKNIDSLDDNDDWIGVSHYRRPPPSFILENQSAVEALLTSYDIISWKPHTSKIKDEAEHNHPGMIEVILKSIKRFYGTQEMARTEIIINTITIHPYTNCFVTKKKLFLRYCRWAWRILEYLLSFAQKNAVLGCYDLTKPRNLGYLSERILPIYCFLRGLKSIYLFEGVYHLISKKLYGC